MASLFPFLNPANYSFAPIAPGYSELVADTMGNVGDDSDGMNDEITSAAVLLDDWGADMPNLDLDFADLPDIDSGLDSTPVDALIALDPQVQAASASDISTLGGLTTTTAQPVSGSGSTSTAPTLTKTTAGYTLDFGSQSVGLDTGVNVYAVYTSGQWGLSLTPDDVSIEAWAGFDDDPPVLDTVGAAFTAASTVDDSQPSQSAYYLTVTCQPTSQGASYTDFQIALTPFVPAPPPFPSWVVHMQVTGV
jgi:hypothetical protein